MKTRCAWVPLADELYVRYHDEEWGVPVHDDRKMFEFFVLESAQAGLSWKTVLHKRENYRRAFAEFDPKRVAAFGSNDVERLLGDAGIIRNRQKIEAAIGNAQAFLRIAREYGSCSKYLWSLSGEVMNGKRTTIKEIPAMTPTSECIAKELKQRGFRFFGPTVCYAHMQAVGMVNDHTTDCFRYVEV